MPVVNLCDAVAKLLNCEVVALHDYLNHPAALLRVHYYLKDKHLRTTYYNRNLQRKDVKFHSIAMKSAAEQHAYEGYLGVSVQTHFYCRHRIRLMWPKLKCVTEYGKGGHNRYYPMELLEIVTAEDLKGSQDMDSESLKNGWKIDEGSNDGENKGGSASNSSPPITIPKIIPPQYPWYYL